MILFISGSLTNRLPFSVYFVLQLFYPSWWYNMTVSYTHLQERLFGDVPDIGQIDFARPLAAAAVAAHQTMPRPRAGTRIGLGLTEAPPHCEPSTPRAAVSR